MFKNFNSAKKLLLSCFFSQDGISRLDKDYSHGPHSTHPDFQRIGLRQYRYTQDIKSTSTTEVSQLLLGGQ